MRAARSNGQLEVFYRLNLRNLQLLDLSVNILPAAYAYQQYAQRLIMQLADDAIFSYAIAPEVAKGSSQSLTHAARILKPSDALIHVVENATGCGFVQLAKLCAGNVGVLNRPGQDPVSLPAQ